MSPLTGLPHPKSLIWLNTALAHHSNLNNQVIHSPDILVLAKLVSFEILRYTGLCTSSSLYLESSPECHNPLQHTLQKFTQDAQPLLYLLLWAELSPLVECTHRTCTSLLEIYIIFAMTNVKSLVLSRPQFVRQKPCLFLSHVPNSKLGIE